MTFGIPHDAAVAGRVLQLGHQHCQAGSPLTGQQAAQARSGDQRHIAIEHQHLGPVGHVGQRLLHGMARAQPLGLLGPQQVGLAFERRAHLVTAMAMDDMDGPGLQLPRRGDHMGQHRPAGHFLQHLGQGRVHPLALAGGEDDHMQGSAHISSVKDEYGF